MRCIACRSSPLPSLQRQHTKKLQQPNLLDHLRSSSSSSSYGFCSGAPLSSSSSVMSRLRRSNATVSDLLSLPITKSHPKPGDIYVFLQTGGVLVLMYWIANFVVPNWISKSMGYDNMGQNNQDTTTTTTTNPTPKPMPMPKEGDNNNNAADQEDEEQRVISSQSKKRGFGGSSSSSRRKSRKI